MIATNVGGIPEIFGPIRPSSCRPATPRRCAGPSSPRSTTCRPPKPARHALRERVRALFSQDSMVEGVLTAYREAIAREVSSIALTDF